MTRLLPLLILLAACGFALAADDAPFKPAAIKVPDGYTVEDAAAPPLVRHPVMAGFDYRGRLFVAEPDGNNLKRADLEKQLPGEVRMLEDTDGDGVFDKSTVFADKLTFPQGALWHDGALYVCSSGALWKFIDKDDDGKADERIKLVGDFGYTGNAADVHGPFLGPDGRIWWCQGRHGHEFKDEQGNIISKGKAARIFNCKTDGSDVQTWATGGMDNPVEIVFTPEGDVIGTCNLMYHQPRGDTLVHWVYGGVYPRTDFVDKLSDEFVLTGDLLPEIHNFGHVAVSGLCLYQSEHFGPNPAMGSNPRITDPYILYITQFNTHKVVRVELSRKGSTYAATKIEDFLTCDDTNVHFTDVMEDADGSLLVIDTGGWFRIGCPVSQVAKPDVRGAIYRIRKKDGKRYDDPRGLAVNWKDVELKRLIALMDDDRPAVRERAAETVFRRFTDAYDRSQRLGGLDATAAQRVLDETMPIIKNVLKALADVVKIEGSIGRRLAATHCMARMGGIGVLGQEYITMVPRLRVAFAHGAAWHDLLQRAVIEFPSHDNDAASQRAIAAAIGRITPRQSERLLQSFQEISPAGVDIGPIMRVNESAANALLHALADSADDRMLNHAIIRALIGVGHQGAVVDALKSDSVVMQRGAAIALEQMRRKRDPVRWLIDVPAPATPKPLGEAEQKALLAVENNLAPGDAARGRVVYTSEKAACATCHRVRGEGGQIGPDMSTIGAIRAKRDLLESILHPSASFARGFEPYTVRTKDGQVHAGIILGETRDSITLSAGKDKTVTVKADDIETIEASAMSIMPEGMDKALSRQELADLIAYLLSLK